MPKPTSRKYNDWDKVVKKAKKGNYSYDDIDEQLKGASERYSVRRFQEEYAKAQQQGNKIITDTANGKRATQKQLTDYDRSVNTLNAFYNDDVFKKYYDDSQRSEMKKGVAAMRDATFRKYYSDYMNTQDFQDSSYEQKQPYIENAVKEKKQNKLEKALDYLSSALRSSAQGQMFQVAPTAANQQMAAQANERLASSVAEFKNASADLNAINQYRADLWNEEHTKKNLATIQNDKELAALVKTAYDAQQNSQKTAHSNAIYTGGNPILIAQSGGSQKLQKGYNEQYTSAIKAIKEKGYDSDSLLDSYTREQNRISAEQQEQTTKKLAEENPVMSSVAYVGANVLQGAAIPQIIASAVDAKLNGYKPLDTNSAAFAPTRFRETVSQTVSENIQKEIQDKTNSTFWANAGSFAYQTGLSMGDFLTLSVLPEPVSLAIMGTSAGVAATKEAADRGVSVDQALLTGVAAGVAEAFFERFSLENLNALKATDKTGILNYVKNILKQQFTEGSEEVFTDIANAISDRIINGNASELAQQYQALVQKYNGDTDRAWKELAKNFGLQLAESYAGGALSGGIIGMYGRAVGNYRLSSVGKSVASNTDELNSLINIASSMPSDSRSAKLVSQINSSTNVTNAKIGELYVNTLNEVTESFNKAETIGELMNEFAAVSENAGDYNSSLLTEFTRSYQENAKRIVETEQRSEKKAAKVNAKANANIADTNTNAAAESDGATTTAQNGGKAEVITATAETKKNTFAIPVTVDSTGNNTIITSVHSTQDGDIRFTTASGETVSVNDITAKNQHMANIVNDAVLETKDNVMLGANGASLYIQRALASNLTGSDYVAFKNYAKQAYLLGVGGANWTAVTKQNAAVINRLGVTTARQFYDAGIADSNALTEIRESNKRSQKKAKQTVQKTGDGTFTNETADTSLDEVFKAVAKKLHIDINYVTDGDYNGSFDAATATLTVVQGAKRGDATTLAHEIGEYGRAYNYDEYKQYVDTVINMLMEMDAISTTDDITAYHKTYHADEINTTIQDAKEELVNDVTARLFFAEGGIEEAVKFVKDSKNISAEEKQNFFDTLKSIINHIVDVISKHVTNKGLRSSEKAVGDMSLDDIKKLRTQFLDVIDGAISNLENGVEVRGETKNSLENFDEAYDYSRNIDVVAKMESVCNLQGTEFQKSKIDLITQVTNWFDKIGNVVHSKYGDITLVKTGVKASLGHGVGRNKAVSFRAVPDVLQKGEIIDFQKNWKGRSYDTAVFAAPIRIADVPYYMAVVVEINNTDNKYYLHEVALTKKEDNMPFKTGSVHKGTPSGKLSSIYSLLQSLQNVNENIDTDGNTLTEAQQEYFKDSKVRDENGRLKVVYRGGTNNDYYVFDRKKSKYSNQFGRGFYFTESKSHAQQYGELREFYLNITNPLTHSGTTFTDEQIKKFIQAVADNEDYGIDNYGYDATVDSVAEDLKGKSDYDLIYDVNMTCIGDLVAATELFNEINGTDFDGFILPTEIVTFSSEQSKLTDNKEPSINPDMRFSLDVPVEEKKDLIAVHNISEEKLMKSLQLGGLPMPSIAVMKAKEAKGNSVYGNISLVFPKSTIDPSLNTDNKIYGGDAWTPVYPTVEYKINEDKANEIYSRARKATEDSYAYKLNSVNFHPSNIEDSLNRHKGESGLIDSFKNDYGMKQLYLAETGEPVKEIKTKETKTKLSDEQVKMYDYLIENFGDTLSILDNGTYPARKWAQENGDEFDNVRREYYRQTMPNITEEQLDNIFSNLNEKPIDKVRLARQINKYRRDGRITIETENDNEATQKEIDSRINQKEYEVWLNDLFTGISEKKGIRNNIDTYTDSGNMRSFEQLHYEETLENVVKQMRTQNNGDIAWFSGIGIWGVAAKNYGTLEQVKSDSFRLQNLSEDEFKNIKRGFGERLDEIAESLENKYKDDNPFIDNENKMTNIIDALRESKTKSGVLKYLKQYFNNASESTVDDLLDLVADIGNMPVDYFEAKPQRAVGFNEIYTAIIPENCSEELINALNEAGVNYVTYEEDNEKARLDVLNSLDDVKFSKDVEDDATVSSFIRENKQLQKSLDYYKMMSKRNTGHKVSRSEIRRIAADLKTSWRSTMSVDEIAEELTALYDHISSGEATWGTIELMGKTLGKELVESAKSELDPETSEVRDYLKTLEISLDEYQEAEVRYTFENMRTWLNDVRKGVKYRKDGIGLNAAWQEMSSLYPYIFDPETNSNEQPIALYEAIQGLYDTVDNSYGYDENELAEMIMLDIYDKYYDIPEVVTPVDRANKKLMRERTENKNRLESVKQADKERYEKKIAEVKKHYQEMNSRLREQKNQATLDKLAKQKAKYEDKAKRTKDTHERSRLRASIRKQLNKILNLASKPTKEKHLPNAIVESVRELAEAVTLDGTQYDARLKEKLNNFRDGFEENKKNNQYYIISELYNDYISDKITDLNSRYGNAPLKELPVEALREINDLMRMTAQTINNINRLFNKERNATIDDYVDNIVRELEPMKKDRTFNGSGKAFFFNTLKPVYFFEYVGSDTMTDLYQDVRHGEDVWAVDISEAKDFVDDLRKQSGYNDWDFNNVTTFDTVDGKVELTLGEVLGLYANTLGEHTKKNLLGGGFVYQAEQRKGLKRFGKERNDNSNHRLSIENIADITGTLTAEQKNYVREMIKYLSTTMGAKGNEVSRELYGVELFKEQMYYPALVWDKSHHQSSKEFRADKKIKNAGFTNAIVPEATNPLILKNFDDVWANHVDEMSKYHAFALVMENFDRVYNTYSVSADNKYMSTKEALENAHGKMVTAYIDDLLKDINGGVIRDSAGFAGALVSKFKKNAVFASASVVVQQPSAVGRALSEISAKYFVGNPVAGFNRNTYNEMKKYCPVAVIKEFGYFDMNMAQSTVDMLNSKSYEGVTEKVKAFVVDGSYRDEAMSFFAAKADEITWTHIWNACKNETIDKHPELVRNGKLTEDGLKKAGERFTEVITKTQVYDSVFSRSGLMRSDNWLNKMATAFMAEPTTSLNMLTNAIVQRKRGKISGGKFARILGSLVAASILNSLLQSLVTAARHDDKDKDWKEVYLAELLPNFIDNLNPINQIAFVRDIVNIFKGYDVTRSDMSVFEDLYNAWKDLNNDNVSLDKKITGIIGALGIFVDVPARNILRDVYAAKNVVTDFFDDYKFSKQSATEQFKDEMNSALGFDIFTTDKDERYKKLYNYQVKGDTERYNKVYEELTALGLDDKKIAAGVKSALIDNDIRIAQAALAYNNGDLDSYIRYIDDLTNDGFTEKTAKDAITSYNNSLNTAKGYLDSGDEEKYGKKLAELLNSGMDKDAVENAIKGIEAKESTDSDEAKMLYEWNDLYNALENGQTSAYEKMYQNALDTKVANGKSEEDAKEEIKKKLQGYYKQDYIDYKQKRSSIESKLNKTGLFSQSDYDDWVAQSFNGTESMKKAFEGGLNSTRQYVNDRVAAKVKTGMTEDSAKHGIRTSISNAYKQEFINGDANTRAKIITYMSDTGLYGSRQDVIKYINKYWLK